MEYLRVVPQQLENTSITGEVRSYDLDIASLLKINRSLCASTQIAGLAHTIQYIINCTRSEYICVVCIIIIIIPFYKLRVHGLGYHMQPCNNLHDCCPSRSSSVCTRNTHLNSLQAQQLHGMLQLSLHRSTSCGNYVGYYPLC